MDSYGKGIIFPKDVAPGLLGNLNVSSQAYNFCGCYLCFIMDMQHEPVHVLKESILCVNGSWTFKL